MWRMPPKENAGLAHDIESALKTRCREFDGDAALVRLPGLSGRDLEAADRGYADALAGSLPGKPAG